VAGGDDFRFAHVLVRDVAYGLVPKEARADLHARFAEWLEGRAGGLQDEVVGHHLEQAHRCRAELRPGAVAERRPLARRAAGHLGAAGRAALARGDVPGGVALLERAADLSPDDEPERGALLPELGLALVRCGKLGRARTVLDGAVERATARSEELAEAHARTARLFAEIQVDPERAAAELARRFVTLRRTFDAVADELGLSRLWRAQALVHWIAGASARADEAWTRAVRHARAAGDEEGRADALCWLASSAAAGPAPVPEAISRCEAIARELEADRMSHALALRPLASLHAMAGRFELARDLLAQSGAMVADLGQTLTSAATHDDAFVALLAGDAARAERCLRQACAELEQMGERALLATTAGMLARALLLQGNVEEAWRFTDVAEGAAAAADVSAQALWRAVRAQLLARRGEAAAARRLGAEAVAQAARTDWPVELADALLAQADVLRSVGDAAAADRATREAIELYTRKGDVASAERARALTAEARA
jgi:predicted ATPase